MKWRPNWHLVQDIAILGTGLALIWPQLILWAWLDRSPSDVLMAWGVGLLTFGSVPHVRAVLGIDGRGSAGGSSRPSPPPSLPLPLPSSAPGEASGGEAGSLRGGDPGSVRLRLPA